MDTKALQLCSRFALQPNKLGHCGKKSASSKLEKCIVNGKCEDIPKEIEQFIVLNPYLETIAQITGKSKFSYEVIESYWLGNDLIKQISPKHYPILIKNLEKQGVPDFFIKEIKDKIPQAFIPTHLFDILHIGVGKMSNSVPFNLDSINNCMIRWGNILSIKKNKCQIKLTELDKEYKLKENVYDINIHQKLTPNLKENDSVAIHWGYIVKKLSTKELTNLIIWTQRFLNSLKS
jgi:hypothetical protein